MNARGQEKGIYQSDEDTGLGRRRRRRRRMRRGVKYPRIVLVGNPNVGKSVIFGALTGKYVEVSNYPGTSVEISCGLVSVGSQVFELVDSPGVNSLVPRSEDEQVAFDIITGPDVIGVIHVIDAKNIRRGLLLTTQLIDLGLPLIVCLNIFDEALERGIKIDPGELKRIFGVEFIPTVATESIGLERLRRSIPEMRRSDHRIKFSPSIENTLDRIAGMVGEGHLDARGVAVNIVAGEGHIPDFLESRGNDFQEYVTGEVRALAKQLSHSPGYEIQSSLMNVIDSRTHSFMTVKKPPGRFLKDRLGMLTMHRWYGIPFILLTLFILYELVGVFGAGVCVDYIENHVFGGVDGNGDYFGIINPLAIKALSFLKGSAAGSFIFDMLVGEYGAVTVGLTYSIAIVFPIVSLFFIFFGLLEDSGYLPRLTVMSNGLFRMIGLNGRAILPLVLGLGCDTMATFTTRILETKKERTIATLLLALGIPCSAQLGVALGMLASVSFWLLLIVVATVALQLALVGYGASKVIKGKPASLIAEVPPFRMPRLKNILIKTYFRVRWFMIEAVPLFILGTFVLFILDKLKLLSGLERAASPVITGILSLPEEAAQAFIIGFLRRDYGAAGLFQLVERGLMDHIQITVGITVMVLFIPCLANFFVIIKERGFKTAMAMSGFIVVYAVIVGGILDRILRFFW